MLSQDNHDVLEERSHETYENTLKTATISGQAIDVSH